MNRRRQSWREHEAAREAQQATWDAAKKAQAEWNAKPRSEQIEDARFVLEWTPGVSKFVVQGSCWMSDALASAKAVEAKAIQAAAEMGLTLEEVWALMQLPDEERTATLHQMGFKLEEARQ
jgi:hypothetical protein